MAKLRGVTSRTSRSWDDEWRKNVGLYNLPEEYVEVHDDRGFRVLTRPKKWEELD